MEKLIIKFNLSSLFNLIQAIVRIGFIQTGNKFSVVFNGSKGYLSNVEIVCEGFQKQRNNVIWIEQLTTKKGYLMSKIVSVFYSEENGIRIQIDRVQKSKHNDFPISVNREDFLTIN